MSEHTCTDCGVAFSLSTDVATRYPGWTPTRCRDCHQRSKRRGAASRRGPTGGRGGPSGVPDELHTVAEVLERYDGGPQDGVFTDGSAIPNPGPGGWGVVWVRDGEVVDQAYGHEADTTNNRMELTALIAAYDLVPPGTPVTIYTDSRLAVDTITKWAAGWARRGWRRKSGDIANLDLVKALYSRAQERPEVRLEWIKAHDGARWNEYADALATAWAREEL